MLILGAPACGKTSIIHRVAFRAFKTSYKTTIGMDFALKRVSLPTGDVKLHLWELQGQEHFARLTRSVTSGTKAIVIVYDVTSQRSLESARIWKEAVDQQMTMESATPIPSVLMANKCDLKGTHTKNDDEIATKFCEVHGFSSKFFVSAKSGKGLDEAFTEVAQMCVKTNAEPETIHDPISKGWVYVKRHSTEQSESSFQNITLGLVSANDEADQAHKASSCC